MVLRNYWSNLVQIYNVYYLYIEVSTYQQTDKFEVVICNLKMTKLRHGSILEIYLNIKHLEFFKNFYYKWLNERLLDIAHVYLFIFLSLLPTFDVTPFEIVHFILIVTLITF